MKTSYTLSPIGKLPNKLKQKKKQPTKKSMQLYPVGITCILNPT